MAIPGALKYTKSGETCEIRVVVEVVRVFEVDDMDTLLWPNRVIE